MPKKKKATAKIKEELTEHCPRCGSANFSISESEPNQRYCLTNTCSHVWLPQSIEQIKLNAATNKLNTLKDLARECEHIINMQKGGECIDTEREVIYLVQQNLHKMLSL